MTDFARETATQLADMPHAFQESAEGCQVCAAEQDDARHVVWQSTADASRERASMTEMVREFGTRT